MVSNRDGEAEGRGQVDATEAGPDGASEADRKRGGDKKTATTGPARTTGIEAAAPPLDPRLAATLREEGFVAAKPDSQAPSAEQPPAPDAVAEKPAKPVRRADATRATATRARSPKRADTRTATRKKAGPARKPAAEPAAPETAEPAAGNGSEKAARSGKRRSPAAGDRNASAGRAMEMPMDEAVPAGAAGATAPADAPVQSQTSGGGTAPSEAGAERARGGRIPQAAAAASVSRPGTGAQPGDAAGDTADVQDNPLLSPSLPLRLAQNIERIEALGHRLAAAMMQRPMRSPGVEGPSPELFATATQGWWKLAAQQPARIIEQQVQYWGDTLRHVAAAQQAFVLQGFSAPEDDDHADRRFANPLWRTNPFYSFVRRQYQINAEAMRKAVAELDIGDSTERRRIEWFTRQIVDMLSPTNFLATNPDALERAIQTEGESLVRGLENLVNDIESSQGDLIVSLADRTAFRVGENIGTSPGEVVHRTPMLELIQLSPGTEQVHALPVVVFPPWINKYYIMDLKPQNSLLRWLVNEGHTVFVVSWKNPGIEHADIGMDDYVQSYLEVIDKVLELTGQRQLNAVGYCIAGTVLTMALGVMKQRGDDRVAAATLFTTLTDFSDQGEFTTFLQDDFIGGIEDEVARTGYLSARLMQRTFSFLRANDLVWGPAIRSYMLGEPPPAFDLLFWNSDGTNLPGRMVMDYLRGVCQENALARDGYEVLGHKVTLADVTVPLCAIACEADHIAPWLHCWRGVAQMGSPDRTFILSESGHIAGIINPPGKAKYGHYISDAGFDGSAQDWRDAASFAQGTWWPHWAEWLSRHGGPMVPARTPTHSLGPAPGTYVHEKA